MVYSISLVLYSGMHAYALYLYIITQFCMFRWQLQVLPSATVIAGIQSSTMLIASPPLRMCVLLVDNFEIVIINLIKFIFGGGHTKGSTHTHTQKQKEKPLFKFPDKCGAVLKFVSIFLIFPFGNSYVFFGLVLCMAAIATGTKLFIHIYSISV